jgi:HEAT repeat protein
MNSENVLSGLTSDDINTVTYSLKLCLVNESLLIQDHSVLELLIKLLKHEDYKIRGDSERLITFYIRFSPEIRKNLLNIIINNLKDNDYERDVWYRYTKLIELMPEKSEIFPQIFKYLIKSEAYAQGLGVYIFRDLYKEFPKFIDEVITSTILKKEEDEESQDFLPKESQRRNEIKKAICWLFWKNPEVLTLEGIKILSFLIDDEDREIRRLACEILQKILHNDDYKEKAIEIFKRKINDPSWRVQKIAIESLISVYPDFIIQDQEVLNRILGLFWYPEWITRKHICELIATHIPLSYKEDLRIFLDLLIAALDDPSWEVRESAAISINRNLRLEKKEYHNVLFKILGLTNDLHEEVRKVSCQIIAERFDFFGDRSEAVFRKILWLLQDPNHIVKKTALSVITNFLNHPLFITYFNVFFDNIKELLVYFNPDVRKNSWDIINLVTGNLQKEYKEKVFFLISNLLSHDDAYIRSEVCTYSQDLSNYFALEDTSVFSNPFILDWKEKILSLLDDEDPIVLESAWETVINNERIFLKDKAFITKLVSKASGENLTIIKFACKICSKFNWIKDDDFLRKTFLQELGSSKDRELRKVILRAFFAPQYHKYLDNKLILQLIQEGQWDVQKLVIPFLISKLMMEVERMDAKEIYTTILHLLENPIAKYRSESSKISRSIEGIAEDLAFDFSEDNITFFFDLANDDARFERWVKLEEKFDFLVKINHPQQEELVTEFGELIKEPVKNLGSKLGYKELLTDDINIDTPLKIIKLMLSQQELVRFSLLDEIERRVDFKQIQYKELKNAIIYTLSDTSIKIRNISWNIVQNNILPSTDVKEVIDPILSLLNSSYADTRSRAIFILLSNLSIKEAKNEQILNKILELIDDSSFLVRNQVWYLFNNEINLAYPRYHEFARKILKMLSSSDTNVRKEASKFIELNLDVLLPIIESYPQHSDVNHLLGTIYCKKKNYSKGIPLFLSNLSKDPSDLNSLLGLAFANILQGKLEDAIQNLKRSKTINPLDFRIYSIWSECMLEIDNKLESKKSKERSKILSEWS